MTRDIGTLVGIALTCSTGWLPAQAAERTIQLAVENMTCAACSFILHKTIAGVPGVVGVEVSPEAGMVQVTFEESIAEVDDITAATQRLGFPSVPVPERAGGSSNVGSE